MAARKTPTITDTGMMYLTAKLLADSLVPSSYVSTFFDSNDMAYQIKIKLLAQIYWFILCAFFI